MNSNQSNNDLFEYFWRYYELQSHQRNQTVLAYYTLLVGLFAGFLVVSSQGDHDLECLILGTIAATAFIFGFLFYRTTNLRNNAREQLVKWEKEKKIEESGRMVTKENSPVLYSYSTLMKWQFILVFVSSVCGMLYLLFRYME